MQIRGRYAVILAIAAAVAVVTTGLAVANTAQNGNVSGGVFNFKPSKVPKKKYHKGALKLGTKTTFANQPNQPGGDTDRVQLFIDDDIKLNLNSVPKCSGAGFSSNTTMAQAMQLCGKANVGKGSVHTGNFSGNLPGCVLVFNGTNKRIVLYARIFASGPANCSNPSTNNGGTVTTTLFGKLKSASGDFGTQLNVDTTTTPLPLGDFTANIKHGNYASARCHDSNQKWNVKVQHTYNDGVKSVDKLSEGCKRS
jgi:hypothetical protein